MTAVGQSRRTTAAIAISTGLARADHNRGTVACAENSAHPGCGQTAMCGDGRYAHLLFVRRAQRTYSVRSLIQHPLERARTEVKLAPGFLVRSAPKPSRVIDCVGA